MACYAKFDGVDGSAADKLHFSSTNVATANLSGHNPGGGGTGVGRVGGKMHFSDITLGIISDKSVPKQLEAAVKGTVLKKVVIHGTSVREKIETTFLEVQLTNAQITSYQLGVLDNNAATDDVSMSLAFEGYKAVFTSGDAREKPVEFEWKVEPSGG